MQKYFEIGKIVNTQGVKGEVRIMPTTDDIKRFELLKEMTVIIRSEKKILTVTSIRYHKQFVLATFKEIVDMTNAEKYKGGQIIIDEKDALKLSENEYYIRDLYDMEVVTEEGRLLGEIKDIIFTGANDVYAIKREGKTDLLIPAIKQCIINVDVKNNKMTVKLLEGLED